MKCLFWLIAVPFVLLYHAPKSFVGASHVGLSTAFLEVTSADKSWLPEIGG